MSRIAPLLRHSPAATATRRRVPITHPSRCIGLYSTHQLRGRSEVATDTKGSRDDTYRAPPRARRPTRTFEDIFISSLVAAGTCRKHRATSSSLRHVSQQTRSLSSAQTRQRTEEPDPPEISQAEYLRLVDFYRAQRRRRGRSLYAEKQHIPLASRLVMTAEQEQAERQHGRRDRRSGEIHPPEDEEQRSVIESLLQLLSTRLGYVQLDQMWSLYQKIHPPRPQYLDDRALRRLLEHLGFVEHWHEKDAMQRYFQVLDDAVAASARIGSHHYTTAITYAGRWMKHTTSKEVKAAIETWMRMEEAGHSADHVTLNVLFDVAVKAGRFALADTIYKEIKARNMPLDRYFRASLIYYAGMKRDGDDVRRAFREFVAAGEIVDTTIMNAVILSLLRAGEAAAAEHVFTKMKRLGEEKFGVRSPKSWVERKELRAELTLAAHRLRAEKELHESSFFGAPFSAEEKREQVQKLSPIAPDSHTYTVLLQYHANTSGDIERIWQLLQEMGEQGLRPHTAAYVHLLKGFRIHGGYAFSGWSHHRLEVLWKVVVGELEADSHVGAPALPAATTRHSTVEETPRTHSEPVSPTEVVQPADQVWQVNDWAADDASQYRTDEAYHASGEFTSAATAVPLAGIVRSGLGPHAQHEADDFDMLGAMMSSLPHTTAETDTVDSQSTAEDEVRECSSPATAASSPSFLESVSLQHLTDAALLPEGGTRLDDGDASHAQSTAVPVESVHTYSPSDSMEQNASPNDNNASSFLDSFSLRHLTDAALLPEGGTPLEEISTSKAQSTALDDTPKYVPLTLADVNPKVVLEADPVSEDDSFDSLPIWRRNREQFNNRNRDSGAHTGPTEGTPPLQQQPKLSKPSGMTVGMALEAVRAFYQCCGRDRMLQVWDEILVRWHDATEQERTIVANEVGQMVRHASRYRI